MTTPRTALLALLLSALPPLAARAADVPLPPTPSGTALQGGVPRTYKLAVLGGFLSEGDVSSLSLQVDIARVATPAGWTRVEFEWHLPIRGGRTMWDGVLTRTVTLPTSPPTSYQEPVGTTDDTVWLFEATPSARLILPVGPGFALHAEAGVGLALTRVTHIEDEQFIGHTTERKLVLAPTVRFALGLTYKLGERLDVVFQPVALARRSSADGATFSALWGLSYRL